MGRFEWRGRQAFEGTEIEAPDEIIDLRGDRDAVVIDLAAIGRAKAVKTRKIQWGLPSPCPECGGAGYLDHIDMLRRVMYQHCPDCFERWAIAEAEIEAAEQLL